MATCHLRARWAFPGRERRSGRGRSDEVVEDYDTMLAAWIEPRVSVRNDSRREHFSFSSPKPDGGAEGSLQVERGVVEKEPCRRSAVGLILSPRCREAGA